MLKETLESVTEDPQGLEHWFEDQLERALKKRAETKRFSLCIMATKGSLDWAYPPFIVASTAAAMGWNVTMFFTFYGLALLKKKLDLKLSGLGNPAMPMKIPYGPDWLQRVEWQMPNLVMAGVPGFETMATRMMRKTLRDKGVAPIEELRSLSLEAGVRMIGCQMTRDLFGWDEDELIPEIAEWAGAASYLEIVRGSEVNLYM